MVDDVAQFSMRGGIFDIYSFGMAEPVRLEFWGDEISELRHFDLISQRSTRDADLALILPVDGQLSGDAEVTDRVSITALFGSDTIVVVPEDSRVGPELVRTWDEAKHHIDLARRRGEDTPGRDELYTTPQETLETLSSLGILELFSREVIDSHSEFVSRDNPPVTFEFPMVEPEAIHRDMKRLREVVSDGIPTIILCDNSGQAERLDELLNEGRGGATTASLAIGVLHGGFIIPPWGMQFGGLRVLTDHEIFRRERRIRRARKYTTGTSIESLTALTPGDYVVHLEHGVGIYRGIETIFVRASTVEVAVIEYEGGDRLNVPLYRIDQLERYRSAGDDPATRPPPRLHTARRQALGGSSASAPARRSRR